MSVEWDRKIRHEDRKGRIFPPMNNEFFFLLTTKYLISYCKIWKSLPENPETDEMRHGVVILT